MKEELYGTRLYINYSHLENNINYLKNSAKHMQIIAMVKANAYGHGEISITKKLEELGVNYFGVADFEEGIRLRDNGVLSNIIVMNPGINNIKTIIENDLEPVIYNNSIFFELIKSIKSPSKKTKNLLFKNKICVHIKINTGMNRWGFLPAELPKLILKLKNIKGITIGSIYSHLASAENEVDDTFTKSQISTLEKVKTMFSEELNYPVNAHIFNSAGLLRFGDTNNKFDYMRLGISLYGGIPHVNLKPVAELKCHIAQIIIINPKETIGYNRKYMAKKRMKIGIIPFGYADGLQRGWGNGLLKFYHNKKLIPTIGDISMDSCTVNLAEIKNIKEGDEVVYFGAERPVWDLAKELNTIPYEITSALSRRIKRTYF